MTNYYPMTLDTINNLTRFFDELYPAAADTGVYLLPMALADAEGNMIGVVRFDPDGHAFFEPLDESEFTTYDDADAFLASLTEDEDDPALVTMDEPILLTEVPD